MIWNPLALLRTMAGDAKSAGDLTMRWTRAFRVDPELADDIIRLGGVMAAQPVRFMEGQEMPDPIDPLRLAFEAGRRDLALKLLAAGNLDQAELNNLLGDHR